ncbi:unnamed protein product [Owenia fusiformis]|uniref:GPI-anchor transamidase component GPAA1 n=1 Tax=Owenia fusiformis TaxID=6347 RepID=A0A8J1Y9N5_OWEFU|nr:unnamed protein product [Owenia fusiformis]
MGLLTDEKQRERFITVISKYGNKLCVLCYMAGLAWFLALAYKPFNAGTYFSENALLPGLVEPEFRHGNDADRYFNDLKTEVKKDKRKMPVEWLADRFRDNGLDVYIQNYTFKYPMGIAGNIALPGQNVYGIVRAPRAGSTEALVISAPYRRPGSGLSNTNGGIALMLAVAKYARRHSYWAKDIIMIVTDNEGVGMQAWLSAYHNTRTTENISPGELHGRSGSIQAAINLEIPGADVSYVDVKVQGLNGQLPNLDLINTVVRLCRRENVPVTIERQQDYYDPESTDGYLHSLKTMLRMMWHQAPGTPTGNHGLFHRYHIEAVTLQGIKTKGRSSNYGFFTLGRVTEGILRSLNNLLERFHQSFFFYLMPATDRYISIGLYMPPFGLLAAAALIKAVSLWISSTIKAAGQEAKDDCKAKNDSKVKDDSKAKDENGDEENESADDDTKPDEDGDTDRRESSDKIKGPEKQISTGLSSLLPVLLMCNIFGVAAYFSPDMFLQTSKALNLEPTEGLLMGLTALFLSAILFPRVLRKNAEKMGDRSGADPEMLKCVALVLQGLVLFSIALMNISLAFFLTLVYTPITLIVWPTNSRLSFYLQAFLLLLISPLFLVIAASLLQHSLFDKYSDPVTLLHQTWQTAQHGVLIAVIDNDLYGNWLFSLATLGVLPLWLMFWALLWTYPQQAVS